MWVKWPTSQQRSRMAQKGEGRGVMQRTYCRCEYLEAENAKLKERVEEQDATIEEAKAFMSELPLKKRKDDTDSLNWLNNDIVDGYNNRLAALLKKMKQKGDPK